MDHNFFNANSLLKGRVTSLFIKTIESIFHVTQANKVVKEILSKPYSSTANMFSTILHHLGTSLTFEQKSLQQIPKKGPLIIISNHPLGIIDGLSQTLIALLVRRDVKILSNDLLTSLPGLKDLMINANNWDDSRPDKVSNNAKAMRQAMQWLNEGHCLCVFPAGEVASWQWRQRRIVEPLWQQHIVRLATKTKSNITPIYFNNTNSFLFHALGALHEKFRTIQLLREVFVKPRTLHATIAPALSPQLLMKLPSPKEQTQFIRQITLCLEVKPPQEDRTNIQLKIQRSQNHKEPIAQETPSEKIQSELQGLPENSKLLENDQFIIYAVLGKRIPFTLGEIGRLREITFRLSREGSGKAVDLDEYDDQSWQLFLWHKHHKAIAGAYRLHLVEAPEQDFYTKTLFSLKRKFAKQLLPAIELGRSFIPLSYQKRPLSLFLLWKGIGEFMYKNQEYTSLFGPVSVANDYSASAKSMLCHYLKEHHSYPFSGKAIVPKLPWAMSFSLKKTIGEMSKHYKIEHFNAFIQVLEDGRGIPTLLRHYLKIHCKIIDFNVDPLFSDVLDGFIVIDTKNIKAEVLDKYCNIHYDHDRQCFAKTNNKGDSLPPNHMGNN